MNTNEHGQSEDREGEPPSPLRQAQGRQGRRPNRTSAPYFREDLPQRHKVTKERDTANHAAHGGEQSVLLAGTEWSLRSGDWTVAMAGPQAAPRGGPAGRADSSMSADSPKCLLPRGGGARLPGGRRADEGTQERPRQHFSRMTRGLRPTPFQLLCPNGAAGDSPGQAER